MSPHRIDNKIPDLVSLAEAAAMLGISKQAVHKHYVEKGQLAGKQVGGTWVFRRALVEKLRDALGKVDVALERPETFVKRSRPKRDKA